MADASEPVKPSEPGPWWMRPLTVLFGMTPEQQRGAVALVLMGGGMWLVYYLVTESRHAENERNALTIRAAESENEKSRQLIALESERARQAMGENAKATTAALTGVASALGRLEARITDLATSNAELRKQIVELNAVITDLKRKLPPTEANYAPPPRAKVLTAAG
jgi:hypothetical protein